MKYRFIALLITIIILSGCSENNKNNKRLNNINENEKIEEPHYTEAYNIEENILLGDKNTYYNKYKNGDIKSYYTLKEDENAEFKFSKSYYDEVTEKIYPEETKNTYENESIHYGKNKEVIGLIRSVFPTHLYLKKDLKKQENLDDYFKTSDNYKNLLLDDRTLDMSILELQILFSNNGRNLEIFERNFEDGTNIRIFMIYYNNKPTSLREPRMNFIQTYKDGELISVTDIVPTINGASPLPFVITECMISENENEKYLILFGYNLFDPTDIRTELHFYKLTKHYDTEELYWESTRIKLKETFFKYSKIFEDLDRNIEYYEDGISFPSVKILYNMSSFAGYTYKNVLYEVMYEIEKGKLFLIMIPSSFDDDSTEFILYEILE